MPTSSNAGSAATQGSNPKGKRNLASQRKQNLEKPAFTEMQPPRPGIGLGSSSDDQERPPGKDPIQEVPPPRETKLNRAPQEEDLAHMLFMAIEKLSNKQPQVSGPPTRFDQTFYGENVTEFLEDFEAFMDVHQVEDAHRARFLKRATAPGEKDTVKYLTEVYPWRQAKKNLRAHYQQFDQDYERSPRSQLALLNAEKPKFYYPTIHKWLLKHRFLCEKIGEETLDSIAQSESLFEAMPNPIKLGVADRTNLQPDNLKAMKYSNLYVILEDYVKLRLTTLKKDEDVGKEEVEMLTKNPAVRKQQGFVDHNADIRDLMKDMRELQISALKSFKENHKIIQQQIQHLPMVIQAGRDEARVREPLRIKTHQIDEDDSDQEEAVQIHALKNPRRSYRCWYCAKEGHFPNECTLLEGDTSLGFAVYESDSQCAWLGNRDFLIPPKLVMRFQSGPGVRRLCVLWAKEHPDSHVAKLVPKLRNLPPVTATQDEKDEIDTACKFLPDHWIINGTQKSNNPLASNPVFIDPVLEDEYDHRNDYAHVNAVAVNAAAHKRPRLDSSHSEGSLDPAERYLGPEKGSQKVRFQDEELTQRLYQDIWNKKVPIPFCELLRLDKGLAQKLAKNVSAIGNDAEGFIFVDPPNQQRTRHASVAAARINDLEDFATEFYEERRFPPQTNTVQMTKEAKREDSDPDPLSLKEGDYLATRICPDGTETLEVIQTKHGQTLMRDQTTPVRITSIFEDKKIMSCRQSLPVIYVHLNTPDASPVEALVDSGAEGNIISQELADQYGLNIHSKRFSTTSYSNTQVVISGWALVRMYVGNVWTIQRVYVAEGGNVSVPFLLGMPFVRSAQVSFEHQLSDEKMFVKMTFNGVKLITPVAGSISWDAARPEDVEVSVPHFRTNVIKFDNNQEPSDHLTIEPTEPIIPLFEAEYNTLVELVGKEVDNRYEEAMKEATLELEEFKRVAQSVQTNTLFKKKGVKIHPLDSVPSDGTTPEGDPKWKVKKWAKIAENLQPKGPYDSVITPKFSKVQKGSRLNEERRKVLINHVKNQLRENEQELFMEMLHNREAALAWTFNECGSLDPAVAPPQVLKVVEHTAWQAKSIPIPRGLLAKTVEILRTRLDRGILEESHASYRNPYFLVMKKDGGLRLINSATNINAVSIRDAHIPPAADEFSEDFAMCLLISLIDFFSGYDQVPLNQACRDLTTFSTPIGLLRMCTLPQGATNSVAQFMRVMIRILYDLIPETCRPFLDDIAVRGPRVTYNQEEALPGIRKYVLEHIQNIDKVLLNVELAGCTVSVAKSQWCQPSAEIVGFLCGTYGRSPAEAKIIKILEWKNCKSIQEVRSFIGLVTFYRFMIPSYSIIANPLFHLLRKDVPWNWGGEQQEAMDQLKAHITQKPTLITLDVSEGAGEIILQVDAGPTGWGAVLMQRVEEKLLPARYESGIWSPAEQKYDQTKRECRGLLCAFRRLRSHLYGLRFILETDALVLKHQLRGAADDVAGSLIMRWLSYLRLFDFDVRHIDGKKNVVADALSRKPPGPSDQDDGRVEQELEGFIDAHLNPVLVPDQAIGEGLQPDTPADKYNPEHQRLYDYLSTLQRPIDYTSTDFRRLRQKSRRYVVRHARLWLRPSRQQRDLALVVDDLQVRKRLITSAHLKIGHKRQEIIYRWLRDRYWWPSLGKDVVDAIRACVPCQHWSPKREIERAIPTEPHFHPMTKIHFDSQYLPVDQGKRFLMEARCDLLGWVEAEPVRRCTSEAMRRFARKIVARYGVFLQAVVDGGPEMRKELPPYLEDLGCKMVTISKYNPRSNGLVEAGHFSLLSALAKLAGNGFKWVKNLEDALFADRTTIRASHGYSPFYLLYGWDPILPLEVEYPTWRLINWTQVTTPEKLFEARLRVVQRKKEDVEQARAKVIAFRKRLAQRTDQQNKHKLRLTPLQEDSYVLVFDSFRDSDMSREAKMAMRWKGPYQVASYSPTTKAYRLRTLDDIRLPGTYAHDQIKAFVRDTSGWWTSDIDEKLLTDETASQGATYAPSSPPRHKGRSSSATVSSHSSSDSDSEYEETASIESTGAALGKSPNQSTEAVPAPRRPNRPTLRNDTELIVDLPLMSNQSRAEYIDVAN